MKINYIHFIFTKLLQKSYGISDKLKFPKILRNILYHAQYKSTHKIVLPYLYKALKSVNKQYYKGIHNSRIIWMFWWQGRKDMPIIAKKCIQSVIDHSNGHKVIIIDRYNVKKYTNISKCIYKKLNEGFITFTHFSDIIRFNLLMNHGGLWIDATMYAPVKLDRSYFNDFLYTSGKYINTHPIFVHGRWVAGLIGGNKGNSLFTFMNNLFNIYWHDNNVFINYFLVDYGLKFAYDHNIGEFQTYIDNMNKKGHNPYLLKFVNLLNKPYNKELYKKILCTTNLFNLTYKERFLDNGKTFYSKLLNNKLYK